MSLSMTLCVNSMCVKCTVLNDPVCVNCVSSRVASRFEYFFSGFQEIFFGFSRILRRVFSDFTGFSGEIFCFFQDFKDFERNFSSTQGRSQDFGKGGGCNWPSEASPLGPPQAKIFGYLPLSRPLDGRCLDILLGRT